MKALVTGANGLIGANIVRALLRQGAQVRALVRPTGDTTALRDLPVEMVMGDMLDPASLATACAGQTRVFHTAVPFSYWGPAAEDLDRTAVEGTCSLLAAAACAGVGRVVITSSTVTLGASTTPEVRDEDSSAEDDPDESAYVRAKLAQERLAREAAQAAGVDVVFALPTMTVGPHGATLGPSNGLIVSYLADPLKLTWAGGCNIASVHDVADGHLLLAERGLAGQRYVLGGENLHWAEVHGLVAELSGAPAPRIRAGALACYGVAAAAEARARITGETPLATRAQARMVGRYYWYSHARAAELGYRPRSARQALAEATAWLAAGPHVTREMRVGMRLAREVHAARLDLAASEQALTTGKAA